MDIYSGDSCPWLSPMSLWGGGGGGEGLGRQTRGWINLWWQNWGRATPAFWLISECTVKMVSLSKPSTTIYISTNRDEYSICISKDVLGATFIFVRMVRNGKEMILHHWNKIFYAKDCSHDDILVGHFKKIAVKWLWQWPFHVQGCEKGIICVQERQLQCLKASNVLGARKQYVIVPGPCQPHTHSPRRQFGCAQCHQQGRHAPSHNTSRSTVRGDMSHDLTPPLSTSPPGGGTVWCKSHMLTPPVIYCILPLATQTQKILACPQYPCLIISHPQNYENWSTTTPPNRISPRWYIVKVVSNASRVLMIHMDCMQNMQQLTPS